MCFSYRRSSDVINWNTPVMTLTLLSKDSQENASDSAGGRNVSKGHPTLQHYPEVMVAAALVLRSWSLNSVAFLERAKMLSEESG